MTKTGLKPLIFACEVIVKSKFLSDYRLPFSTGQQANNLFVMSENQKNTFLIVSNIFSAISL